MDESSKALPSRYVDGLFERLLAYYGEKFTRMWSVMDPKKMRDIWAAELGDLSAAELKRGLAACRTREWPPTLPEFRNLCRAPLDYESAFYEAAQRFGMHNSAWSSPAVYWAAVQLGNDVRTLPYKSLVGRWKTALDWAVAHRADTPVPQRDQAQLAPPSTGGWTPMPDHIKEQFAHFSRTFGRVA